MANLPVRDDATPFLENPIEGRDRMRSPSRKCAEWLFPDKSLRLVRYYGWYLNKMRKQREKHVAEEPRAAGNAVEIMNVSEHEPRRIPSPRWGEFIKKTWETDPILCPQCSREMGIISLIDDRKVIENMLPHLGLWEEGGARTFRNQPLRRTYGRAVLGRPLP